MAFVPFADFSFSPEAMSRALFKAAPARPQNTPSTAASCLPPQSADKSAHSKALRRKIRALFPRRRRRRFWDSLGNPVLHCARAKRIRPAHAGRVRSPEKIALATPRRASNHPRNFHDSFMKSRPQKSAHTSPAPRATRRSDAATQRRSDAATQRRSVKIFSASFVLGQIIAALRGAPRSLR